MSVQYGAIGWNRQKKVYDLTLRVVAGAVPRHLSLVWALGETRARRQRRC